MELKKAMLERRSIRKFKKEPLKEKDIQTLLEYAMAGPSARNMQPWEFFVVSSKEHLLKIRESFNNMNFEAPLAIVVCGHKDRFLKAPASEYWIQDCSAAIENILLGAVDLSLGALWCGITPQNEKVEKIKEILNLNNDFIPLGLVYVGYPDEIKEARTQFDKGKIHYIK